MLSRRWSREAEARIPVGGLLMAVGPTLAHDAPPEVDSHYAPGQKAPQYSKFSRLPGDLTRKAATRKLPIRRRFAGAAGLIRSVRRRLVPLLNESLIVHRKTVRNVEGKAAKEGNRETFAG